VLAFAIVAGRITLTLERSRGVVILRVVLPGALELPAVHDATNALDQVLAPAHDARIGMLVDARALDHAASPALVALGALEARAGRAARVVRVARLVSDLHLAEAANRAAVAAGIDGVVRAFTREDEALSFAEGPPS
jgi:hypothetical protein